MKAESILAFLVPNHGIIKSLENWRQVNMEVRANALWRRFKANRVASTLVILLTLAVGIWMGIGVFSEGKGRKRSSLVATPCSVPPPRQIAGQSCDLPKSPNPPQVHSKTEC